MMSEVKQESDNASMRPLHEIFKVAREFYSPRGGKEGKTTYMCIALEDAKRNDFITEEEACAGCEWIEFMLESFVGRLESNGTLASGMTVLTGKSLSAHNTYIRNMAALAWDAMIDKLEHDYNESN